MTLSYHIVETISWTGECCVTIKTYAAITPAGIEYYKQPYSQDCDGVKKCFIYDENNKTEGFVNERTKPDGKLMHRDSRLQRQRNKS